MKVKQNGFSKIQLKNSDPAVSGGGVLAEVQKKPKQIVIYSAYFTAGTDTPELKALPFSIAEIALMHELIRAFDISDDLSSANLQILGWTRSSGTGNGGFIASAAPGYENKLVTTVKATAITDALNPIADKDGPGKAYLEGRDRAKDFGYPSINSLLGGPSETFAELGAYLALDPTASTYISVGTAKWFKKNVLR